jgi:putative tryptophan/tyrosine transport system substrate-binding protein
MIRREFVAGLGAAVWPAVARAQQGDRVRRIGVLLLFRDDPTLRSWDAAFERGLREQGWTIGTNLLIDYRILAGDLDRLNTVAAELVAQAPDVLFTAGAVPLAALRKNTRSLPIVFAAVTDPVLGGFIDSLAHPGGNITGFTNFQYAMVEKWLQLLKEVAPRVMRVGLMQNPQNADWPGYNASAKAALSTFGAEPMPLPVIQPADIELAMTALAENPNPGLIVLPDAFLIANIELLVASAARHRVPAIYPFRLFPDVKGLMSYGPDLASLWYGAATYVARVLRGEKPADLPVQAPTKFELVINLKTAKALGLTIPPNLLAVADEVIE